MPAENFDRTFIEWRDGHNQCVNSKGKEFKGRRCAAAQIMSYNGR